MSGTMNCLAEILPREVTFDRGWWVHLLWAVAALGLIGALGIWRRRRGLRRFAAGPLLARISPPLGWVRPAMRLGLVVAALACMAVAIGGPRWGEQEQEVIRRNIDVMVLLDVSRSMLARDLQPNRLQRAKIALADDLLPALGGDRVGLITFAGKTALKCPLTSDYGYFRLVLDDVSTNSVPVGGTLIGDAIREAESILESDKLDSHKTILLITDGEDHESYPVEAAKALWEKSHIPIIAVALGDEREGARVPVEETSKEYLKYKGDVVWSKANFDDLRRMASISELNLFVPVGTRNFDLGLIYRTRIVPAIKFQQQSSKEHLEMPARFHPFAIGALVLLLVESVMRDGRSKILSGGAKLTSERAA